MIATTACRDAQTELSTAPAPHAAARNLSVNSDSPPEGTWNTYSAVVTLARADSSLFGNLGARDVRFRVTRTRRQDGTWATSVLPVSDAGTINGTPGQSALGFSRIEITNSAMKSFNASGEQLTRPIPDVRKGTDFEERARRARARHPGQFPELPAMASPVGTNTSSPQPSGSAGLDMLIAGPEAGKRARFRLARVFSLPPERRGPALRYSQTQGDLTWEVTVDSLTGVPLEAKGTRSGAMALRVTHTYDLLQDGVRVLRETRVERSAAAPGGFRVFVARYDSVSVGSNSESVQ
jgi:hypothetical protein